MLLDGRSYENSYCIIDLSHDEVNQTPLEEGWYEFDDDCVTCTTVSTVSMHNYSY